jgi:hypothetical protein
MTSTTSKPSLKTLEVSIGGLSKPAKMPCPSYGLPAAECKVGSKLRKVAGSTCSDCYACKGQYGFPNVQAAQYRRLEAVTADLETWTATMIDLLGRKGLQWFRWHDSGDLQSVDHLSALVHIAKRLPGTRFWLPTREKGFVAQWLADHPEGFPENLTVRLSAAMIDSPPVMLPGVQGSAVHDKAQPYGFRCKAPEQNGECQDCRACWHKEIEVVSYARH